MGRAGPLGRLLLAHAGRVGGCLEEGEAPRQQVPLGTDCAGVAAVQGAGKAREEVAVAGWRSVAAAGEQP